MTTIIKFLRPLGLAAATVAAGSFILQSAPAHAAQLGLVTNGDFSEGGTGWTATPGTTSIVPVSSLTVGADPALAFAVSGFGNVAAVGTVPAVGATPTISSGSWTQTLVTNPGSTYELSYNFANYSFLTRTASPAAQTFQVTLNDSVIAGTLLIGTVLPSSLSPTTATFTGTGNDKLSFVFRGVTASAIDNVRVTGDAFVPTGTQAPEPFTIIGTLIGGSAAIRMRRKLNVGK
jgi:hypothetical protein